MSERVAVLIPALNAAESVAAVVTGARELVEHVVVVDDGSRDATGNAARAAGAVVLRHESNRGKGGALKTGFAHCLERSFDAVITLDADAQHLPAEIPKFIDEWLTSRSDLIIGSRDHLFHGMLARRRAANRFSAAMISRFAGVRVEDSQSGFRLYSARLLREVEVRASGFDFESEIIVRAGRRGYLVRSIPIDLGFVNGISTSHYRPVRDTLKIAATVVRARFSG